MKGKLILTVEQSTDKTLWDEIRKQGIGGSEAAIIVGKNKYKSAYVLWQEKVGLLEQEDLSDNEYVYWGNVLEQAVADKFCLETHKTVRRCGTLQDEQVPYFHANIDRWVVGENAGLECKTANGYKAKAWEGDEVPDDYYLQCQWYMGITGAERWYIACLIGGNHFVQKTIERNESIINELRYSAQDFWENNVKGGKAPEIDGSECTTDNIDNKYPASNKGTEIALPMAVAALLVEYDQQKNLEAIIKERKTAIENQIKLLMGEAEIGSYQDRKVTWKNVAGRITIDGKKLQANYPDAYAACMKVGKPSRRFEVK